MVPVSPRFHWRLALTVWLLGLPGLAAAAVLLSATLFFPQPERFNMNQHAYDAIASEWDAVRTTLSPAETRLLGILCESLDPGSHVLDLGCGTGRPIAEHLDGRGLKVTGVDQSANMLEIARSRLPGHSWVLSSIEGYVPAREFAAAIAWDSLFHIPRAAHAAILARVRSCLPVGGRFALTIGGSDQGPFTDTMFGMRFFYDSHPPVAAIDLLRAEGFEVLHSEFLNLPTTGRDKGRFAIVAHAA